MSWKTSLAGSLTIIAAAITFVIVPLLHGEAPNWSGFIVAASPGLGLIAARDHDVTDAEALVSGSRKRD